MQFDRRQLLLGGVGATAGLMLPRSAFAQSPATIGTFPEGVTADSVFVGLTIPLTGVFSGDGGDLKLGYELAIAQINAGGDIAQKWGLKGKGVLGRQIRHKVSDTEGKPNLDVQSATQFIQRDKAIMVSGSVSSASAIALEELGSREKVLYMVGIAGSNDITGKNCQRYGFRSQQNAYMAAKGLAPVVAKALGKNIKMAFLVPDYTYGHTVYDSFAKFSTEQGWKQVAKEVVPLGTTDYSSALLNIANSGADVFVNIAFGGDAVASTKQAEQFGVLKRMKLVVPNLSSFQDKELGAEIMQGVYGSCDFWFGMQDNYPLAKTFVEAFVAQNKYYPRWGAHIGYMQTYLWAMSVERANTFNPVDVIKAMENSKAQPYETTIGKVYFRAEDHQMVRPIPILRGKKPSEMKHKEDFYDIVEIVDGESVMNSPDLFGCKLGPYT
ncbi:ABC transporter substrate-binding protein [Tardiphaga sp. vice352]|uniref:ABC transporter substrate-binding protein n=1 Tax=unclassified Tardiphaga TaxID=2631404 RepID=UPI001162059A|nr:MULTISPECIES: ABC transporter substrate-binding protein [unclassified Tardiphaga]QDM14770.1 ABC transporter substrate-binding protein [Tardiphaga sp. vice278]QDM24950.1 ABC transporter substrate-binding protein [Tardiphaga sp. vice304]QDM30160.1 ABC transporter substrate-binding protein [Tardiphaga sp. vice352]